MISKLQLGWIMVICEIIVLIIQILSGIAWLFFIVVLLMTLAISLFYLSYKETQLKYK